MGDKGDYIKGRGAQVNTANPYFNKEYVTQHPEGLDEAMDMNVHTTIYYEQPKKIVNKVDSPDLGMDYSMNPYQGCEHGCIYCYARNTHQYWGFSAGMDFEQRIIAKKNAHDLLEKQLRHPKWEPKPIMLSGNTDCYQPIEHKLEITRKMLEVLVAFRHPVAIITKNSLILRDLDLLKTLNKHRLVSVAVSVTTLNESLRRKLEPRTAAHQKRLEVINTLSQHDIPVMVMAAPIIPGLNDHEIPDILEQAALNGAWSAAYVLVRLNGAIGEIFEDWIHKSFPEKADKVLSRIKSCHEGKLNENRWGTRMRGEGNVAESIEQLFKMARQKYFKSKGQPFQHNLSAFRRPKAQGQLELFG